MFQNLSFSLHKLDVQKKSMLLWSVLGRKDPTTHMGGE